MNANERYISSLEEQLEKAKAKIKELEQSRQADVSGAVCDFCNGYGRKSANVLLGSSKCPKCGL